MIDLIVACLICGFHLVQYHVLSIFYEDSFPTAVNGVAVVV